MSNESTHAESDCHEQAPDDAVDLIITPHEKDLGEFTVRRLLPAAKCRMVGPWVFFDHMGPAVFAPGQGVNVRPHPHINIATVTYLFDGEILHRDSVGSFQAIRPGDINLMVAGSGIVHSERERAEVRMSEHRLHGLQLWMALPESCEEIDPAFYHYPAADIPSLTVNGVSVRVMMGTAFDVTSPVKTYIDTVYVEAGLQPGQQLVVPDANERAVYVASGSVNAGGTLVPCNSMAVLSAEKSVTLEALETSRIAIIGGESPGVRFLDWNFVSSRIERIEQARQDWRDKRFARVVGDEDEFIPLPD